MATGQEVYALCYDCARSAYGRTAPNERYTGMVAQLLMGTAAQESNLLWRRQRSCSWQGSVGGFSLWQVEYKASVLPSLAYLVRRPDVAANVTAWLWQDPHARPEDWLNMDAESLLYLLRGWDRIGCLMARLHYLRVSTPVPEGEVAQAHYWKRYYNTAAGKGTVEQYLGNWWQHCDAVINGVRQRA